MKSMLRCIAENIKKHIRHVKNTSRTTEITKARSTFWGAFFLTVSKKKVTSVFPFYKSFFPTQ